MKPSSKYKQRIFDLSKTLKPLTDKQDQYAIKNGVKPFAYQTKKETVCMECGTSFQTTKKTDTCPNCNKKLIIIKTLHKYSTWKVNFCIIDKCEEFQVIRYFQYISSYFKHKAVIRNKSEIIQHWIDQNGKMTTIARTLVGIFGTTRWDTNAPLEIRAFVHNGNKDIFPDVIYPGYKKKLIPNIIRNGFNGNFYDQNPNAVFRAILINNKLETLFKVNAHSFIKHVIGYGLNNLGFFLDNYWEQIRICIKNNYIPYDVKIWRDYINLLKECNKDILNSHYVCPNDLKAEHDFYVAKVIRIHKRKRKEDQIKEIRNADIQYQKQKSKFFNLKIHDKNLRIVPLKSVDEFLLEGNTMNHCVFTNKYYEKDDSLILSAQVNGKRTETIEFSLEEMKVVQAYGANNIVSTYHNQILGLMKKSVKSIKEIIQN